MYLHTGNHWMKEVISQLYIEEHQVPDHSSDKHAFERIPILEMAIDIKQCMQAYMGEILNRIWCISAVCLSLSVRGELLAQWEQGVPHRAKLATYSNKEDENSNNNYKNNTRYKPVRSQHVSNSDGHLIHILIPFQIIISKDLVSYVLHCQKLLPNLVWYHQKNYSLRVRIPILSYPQQIPTETLQEKPNLWPFCSISGSTPGTWWATLSKIIPHSSTISHVTQGLSRRQMQGEISQRNSSWPNIESLKKWCQQKV